MGSAGTPGGCQARMTQDASRISDVRFGSKADIARCQADVRFTPKADMDLHGRHVRFVP